MRIICMVMQMHKFLSISGFKWINLKEFGLNKNTSNSSKAGVLEIDLEYLKELRELHNDYRLASKQKSKTKFCLNIK